jgi:hypothetical protein
VDTSQPVFGKSSGILAMLNVEGNIYIGYQLSAVRCLHIKFEIYAHIYIY